MGLKLLAQAPPAPGSHEVLTAAFLALWAELKIQEGQPESLKSGTHFPPSGCVFTQGGPGVGHRETYPWTVVFHFLFLAFMEVPLEF